jgi:uncharacterized protein (DUF302 family)
MKLELDRGLVHLNSPHSVLDTMNALEAAVRCRGLGVTARIDHRAAAADAGLTMRPTELLIFGNPKAGTPLMLASPLVAIDLPLKALSWQDAEGRVWLSFNSPQYIQERYGIPDVLVANISGIASICEEAVR